MKFLLSAFSAALFATIALGELLVEESFDYTAGGPLVGMNGGIGWSGAHSTSDFQRFLKSSEGLSYGNLEVSGNAAEASYSSGVSSMLRNIVPIESQFYYSFLLKMTSVQSAQDHHLRIGIRETDFTRIQIGKESGSNDFWVELAYPNGVNLPFEFQSGETTEFSEIEVDFDRDLETDHDNLRGFSVRNNSGYVIKFARPN